MNYFAVEGSLYQWDTGRRVTLTLPYDEYASVVEFSVNNEAEALVVSVVDNVAQIPNKLLQRSGSLRLWAVTIEENGRQTRRYGNLPIFPRAKPDDYVYTETEIMDYRKVAEDLAELVQRVEEIEENGVQGGGAVASVNGKTGEVYLNAADVGALPTTGGNLTGNLTAPRLISTAADADGNIYEVQLYPTANGGLYMPLRHNGAVANAMSMSQSATTFGKPVAISSGGHGGKNAAEGRQNLSLYSKEEIDEKITNTQKEIERLTEEIAKKDKPLVYIDGVIPTTKDNVLAEMRVVSSWLNLHAYIKIKCQGATSMTFPKKNFTVTLYRDEARTIPLYITIPGWKVASNKFVLKANWVDPTHARNIISACLWSEIVASRPDYDSLPVGLRNSPNNGAINGFPIIVTTNGTYQGIYTWNIGKDDWLWGMDEDNPKHVLLCGETNTVGTGTDISATNFRKPWSGIHEDDWSVEVGENSEAVKDALNALTACLNFPEPECKAQLDNYLDIHSAIDYDLLMCVAKGVDSVARNMLMGTYTLRKWICGMYDLDETWKGDANSTHLGLYYNEQNSLLWERIEKLYATRLKERGRELRKTVLSYGNIMGKFEGFMTSIGKDAYADDLVAYPDIPNTETYTIWQLRNFVRDRLAYFDKWLDELKEVVLCEGITLDKTEIEITDGTAQTITATPYPANCNDVIVWRSSNPAIVSVNAGIVTPISNGDATITATCGSYSTSCSVSVSGIDNANAPVYSLASPKTISTAADVIDTGVKLFDSDKDFTFAIDFVEEEQSVNNTIAHSLNFVSGNYSEWRMFPNNTYDKQYYAQMLYSNGAEFANLATSVPVVGNERRIFVVRHTTGNDEVSVTGYDGSTVHRTSAACPISIVSAETYSNVFIGGTRDVDANSYVGVMNGTIHRCEIYDRYLSDDEVTTFINGMTN